MHCRFCSAAVQVGIDKFCPNCGQAVLVPSPAKPAPSQALLQEQYLVLSAAIVVPLLLFIIAFPDVTGIGLMLLSLGLSFLTVAVWHVFAPRIASLMIHGFTSKSKYHVSSGKSVLLVQEPVERPLKVKEVLVRAFFPLIFVLVVANYLGSIPFISSYEQSFAGPSALRITVFTYLLSLFLLPFISVLIVPVIWIMNGLGVRFLDPKKKTVENFQVNSILLNLLSIGTVLSFFYQIFTATSPEGIAYNVGAIITLAWLLYPPSLVAAVLYHKYSISKHIAKVHLSFEKKGAGIVRWRV